MKQAELRAVARRLLTHLEHKTLDTCATALQSDGACFSDPLRCQRERHILFRRTPQVAGWAGEVAAPGAYITRDIADVPVLVIRDGTGVLRAFRNACSHRGMRVAEGAGVAQRFTCPYHAWTFDAAGALVGIPRREQFPGCDPAQLGLRPLPVTIAAGLIVVGLEPDVEVEGFLAELEPAHAGFRYGEYRFVDDTVVRPRANWKLLLDASQEGYHVPALHRHSIAGTVLNHSLADTFGQHSRFILPYANFADVARQPATQWPERLPMLIVTTIFPSTILIESRGGGQLVRTYPGAQPHESVVYMAQGTYLAPDETSDDKLREKFRLSVQVLLEEDFPAVELCQRGYDAGARSLVAGTGEPLVQHWHRVWENALDAAIL